VTIDGRKVVGISQRRSRGGAVFQCAIPVVWDPAVLLEVLRAPAGSASADDLATVAAGIGRTRAEAVVPAFLARLP
jgi:lipoate-protein ligase A